LARTGSLPPTVAKGEQFDGTLYKTLAEARRKASGPVLLFPEATTSNGRAVLNFGDGVIAEEVGAEGMVWIKFMR
jgi:1-acyl-sn-glycerol-3-phosphate acyltransferase